MANPTDSNRDDPPTRRAALLRAAADGEIGPSEAGALEAHLLHSPEDREVIAFERRLREQIAAAAPSHAAPDALRRRVEALSTSPRTNLAGRRWSARSLWAVAAASVALAAAGIFVASQIPARLPSGGEVVNTSHRAALTRFLGWQHAECEVHADSIKQRFDIGPASDAPTKLAAILRREPDLGAIRTGADNGIEYLGGARCAVPGRGESVHIVLGYRDPETAGVRRLASLFVQDDHNELALDEGRTYHMRPRAGEWNGRDMTVCVWRRNGLIYFLVGTSAEALDAARRGVGVDPVSGEF